MALVRELYALDMSSIEDSVRAALEEPFSAGAADAMIRVRNDPGRARQLVVLRLDPTDDEAWLGVGDPEPPRDNWERVVAARVEVPADSSTSTPRADLRTALHQCRRSDVLWSIAD